MQAGRMDRRITIQHVTETQNDYGEAEENWKNFVTCWAEVKPVRGKEFFEADQINARIDTIFRIRWADGISPKMRIIYNEQIYNIYSLVELGRRDGLEINAYAEVE